MTTYNVVTMSVYASRHQEVKADRKHRRSTYNLVYQKVDSSNWKSGDQGRQRTAGNRLPDHSDFKTLDLKREWDDKFQFRLALWSTDVGIDEANSWARCTFRPAHKVGVVTSNSLYPLSDGAFKEYLQGAYLNDTGKWQDLSEMNPADFGMNCRTGPHGGWVRHPGMEPYTFSKAWQGSGNLKKLIRGGQYEIGVQVGLYYKPGTPDYGTGTPVFCEVDPEMDLGPD